jgi:hypothetical protein
VHVFSAPAGYLTRYYPEPAFASKSTGRRAEGWDARTPGALDVFDRGVRAYVRALVTRVSLNVRPTRKSAVL